MNIEAKSEPDWSKAALSLPREIGQLLRREREIATIVYELGAASANEVLERLETRLANPSVRSMLNRLVDKGILVRFLAGRTYLYLPGLSRSDSRRLALGQFADDHFGGSLALAALTMQEMLALPPLVEQGLRPSISADAGTRERFVKRGTKLIAVAQSSAGSDCGSRGRP